MDNYDYYYTKEITNYEIDYNIAAAFADIIADDLIEIRDGFNGVEGDDIPQIIADLNAQISRLQKITADFYKQVEDSKKRATNSDNCFRYYKNLVSSGKYDEVKIDGNGLINYSYTGVSEKDLADMVIDMTDYGDTIIGDVAKWGSSLFMSDDHPTYNKVVSTDEMFNFNN